MLFRSQANFVKKIDAKSRASVFAWIALVLLVIGGAILWEAYTIVREFEDLSFWQVFFLILLTLLLKWLCPDCVPGWLQ